jgi:hypothetical protein
MIHSLKKSGYIFDKSIMNDLFNVHLQDLIDEDNDDVHLQTSH